MGSVSIEISNPGSSLSNPLAQYDVQGSLSTVEGKLNPADAKHEPIKVQSFAFDKNKS
jgi:hypothetical protein